MFGSKGKEISEKKLRNWQEKGRPDKLVDALNKGNQLTRLKVLEILGEINMSQVKTEIIKCFDDADKVVALKAADVLESMGVTPAERELVASCRAKNK